VSARYENKLRTTSSHVLDVPFARVTSQHGGGGGRRRWDLLITDVTSRSPGQCEGRRGN